MSNDQDIAAVKALDLQRPAIDPYAGISMRVLTEYRPGEPVEIPHVQEGPGYDFAPGDEVEADKYPFAFRLHRHLERNGAVVGFEAGEGVKHGMCAVDANGILVEWTQFHAARDEAAEALGDLIMRRIGKLITFGQMFMPHVQSHLIWCGFEQSAGVWVRQIGDYHIGSDSIIQRRDVIVRKTQ